MSKFYVRIFCGLLSIALVESTFSASGNEHVKGQIIASVTQNNRVELITARNEYTGSQKTGLHAVRPLSKAMNYWLFEFNTAVDEKVMLNKLRMDPDVTVAQFNYLVTPRVIPNDSLFTNEWDCSNTGQNGGLVGADIEALQAWDITTGGLTADGDTIVVAVVDCGFYLQHEDLDFWKNYAEIPGNGIDDDNNGYMDDFNGWNGFGDGNISSCDHGTHVSGTIGARGNNHKGVAGVNWNVKVMPLQYGNGDDAGAIESYGYAFAMRKLYNETNGAQGAFVVSTNSSFGVDFGQPADHPLWCSMYDSLGSVGILSAGAGPNLNIDIDVQGDIPTACPSDWLISVTNTTKNDLRNSGAGYGQINMDIGAPGTNIWSTTPNNHYSGAYTGTSMATPHVAGAVALMWSGASQAMIQDYKNNPSALAVVMKNIMLENVDTLASMNGITSSGGRLNLHKSLIGVQNYRPDGIGEHSGKHVAASYIYPNPVQETFNIYYSPFPIGKNIELTLFDAMGKLVLSESMNTSPYTMKSSGLSPGVYFLRLNSQGETVMKKLIKN